MCGLIDFSCTFFFLFSNLDYTLAKANIHSTLSDLIFDRKVEQILVMALIFLYLDTNKRPIPFVDFFDKMSEKRTHHSLECSVHRKKIYGVVGPNTPRMTMTNKQRADYRIRSTIYFSLQTFAQCKSRRHSSFL